MYATLRALHWLHVPIPFIAWGMLRSCSVTLERPLPPALCLAAAAGAWAVYLLDRCVPTSAEDRINHPLRSAWISRQRLWFKLLIVCSLSTLAGGVLVLDRSVSFRLLFFIPLGLFYILPLFPGGRRIKDIPFLKTPVILLGWAGVCLLLPDSGRNDAIGLWFLYRILYLLPNLLCADWCDRKGDAAAGLRSLARQLGERGVRHVSSLSLAAALLLAGRNGTLHWLYDAGGAGVFLLHLWLAPLKQSAERADAFLLWPLVSSFL